MAKHGQNVIAYQPLIDFVNEPAVTSRNWHAAIVNMWEAWPFSRERGQAGQFPGIAKPEFRRGERITSPDPVCEVQKELRADFDRLISPAPDPLPSRFLRGLPESYKASPPHNVQ